VAREGWRRTRLSREGVATSGVVTAKHGGGRGRSVLRYEYRGPDGTRHEGASPVDAGVWRAHEVGSALGVVYARSRPWISAEQGEVNADRSTLGLPPL
jgi:hypothetical protein